MISMKWIRGWILLGMGLLLFGCATTQDVRILDRDIQSIHSQMNTLQKEKDSLRKELSSFQKETQGDLSTLQGEVKKFQADLLLLRETHQSEFRTLSTEVEEYKDSLRRPSKEIDRVKEDIALRTRHLEEKEKTLEEKNRAQEERAKAFEEKIKGMEERFKGLEGKVEWVASKQVEAEKTAASAKEAEAKGTITGMGDLYKEAFETLQKGDLEGARRRFETFLKQYPNTELSDNAQFWIGETYYLKKDYEKAILEYEKVIAKYPEGDKVPAAILKQALAFLELGDKTNARNLLKRVIERYPQSDQVDIAKKKLEGIR